MLRRAIVLGGVLVLRLVAAADVAAGAAQAQVHPGVAHLQAFLAAVRVRLVGPDLVEVIAVHFAPHLRPRAQAIYFLMTSGERACACDGSPPVSRNARRWRRRSQHWSSCTCTSARCFASSLVCSPFFSNSLCSSFTRCSIWVSTDASLSGFAMGVCI